MIDLNIIPAFYTMIAIENHEELPRPLRARGGGLADHLASTFAPCLSDYLTIICAGEARHALMRARAYIDGITDASRETVYRDCIRYNRQELMDRLIEVFGVPWSGNGYGGPKWRSLALLVSKYGQVSDRLFVDAIVNKQHNGGNLFNKSEVKYIMSFDLGAYCVPLIEYLNYRNRTPNYLGGIRGFIMDQDVSMRMPLQEGRCFIEACRYLGVLVPSMRSIKPYEYTPVKWGKHPVGKLVKNAIKIRCAACNDHITDYWRCSVCGNKMCTACALNHNCTMKHTLFTCIVCGDPMRSELAMGTACGSVVHQGCMYHHLHHCLQCVKHYKTSYRLLESFYLNNVKQCSECGGVMPGHYKHNHHLQHKGKPCPVCKQYVHTMAEHCECYAKLGKKKALEYADEYQYDALMRYRRLLKTHVKYIEERVLNPGAYAWTQKSAAAYIETCEKYGEIDMSIKRPTLLKYDNEGHLYEHTQIVNGEIVSDAQTKPQEGYQDEQEEEIDIGDTECNSEDCEPVTADGVKLVGTTDISKQFADGSDVLLKGGLPQW